MSDPKISTVGESGLLSDNFTSLPANLSIQSLKEVLETVEPENLILSNFDAYYLLKPENLSILCEEYLERGEGPKQISSLFDRIKEFKIDVLPESTPLNLLPQKALILDNTELLGFIDTTGAFDGGTIPSGGGREKGIGRSTYENHRKIEGEEESTYKMLSEFPDEVKIGEIETLELFVFSGDRNGTELKIQPKIGDELILYVSKLENFEIEGEKRQKLIIPEQGNPDPLLFSFIPSHLGKGLIRITAQLNGKFAGFVVHKPKVVKNPKKFSTSSMSLELWQYVERFEQSQLNLTINEFHSGTSFSLEVTAKTLDENSQTISEAGTVPIRTSLSSFLKEFYAEIRSFRSKNIGLPKETMEQVMALKCQDLYDTLFPENIRKLLWDLKDQIQVITVISDEPYIPWEIMKMTHSQDDMALEGEYLCEKFIIARQFYEGNYPRRLELNRLALLVPEGSNLPFAKREREEVLDLKSSDLIVEDIPATLEEVFKLLQRNKQGANIIHFCGHGKYDMDNPDNSGIVLNDKIEFSPDYINGKQERGIRAFRPVVFLNCCKAGRTGYGLTSMGGFAHRFLKKGASAFLGAIWSINDEVAYTFAHNFYEEFLAGNTLGEAVQNARLRVRDELGGIDWLAYTLYGDPYAALNQEE